MCPADNESVDEGIEEYLLKDYVWYDYILYMFSLLVYEHAKETKELFVNIGERDKQSQYSSLILQ